MAEQTVGWMVERMDVPLVAQKVEMLVAEKAVWLE
jgi:hypothetical protein